MIAGWLTPMHKLENYKLSHSNVHQIKAMKVIYFPQNRVVVTHCHRITLLVSTQNRSMLLVSVENNKLRSILKNVSIMTALYFAQFI